MTLEEAFAAVEAKNWRVLNLFQIGEPGSDKLVWRCNLQVWVPAPDAGTPSEFAEHKNPVQAVRSAMKNMETALARLKPLKTALRKVKGVENLSERELEDEAAGL